jgi:NAD(P)-dependent dehydrogenase (short-subunit alcohol dehydrogenase family)
MAETRFALVTGANRGIGLEIVRHLSRLGIVAVIGSRDLEKGRIAAESLKSEGIDVPVVQLDVCDAASVARGVAETNALFGHIDILINNAGIYLDRRAQIIELAPETVIQTFDANTIGALRMIQAIAPGMQERNFGRIVNVSSMMAQLKDMGGGSLAYRMSKVALNALTRVAAVEITAANVKINAASPGWVKTEMGGEAAPSTVAEGADTPVWLATLPDDGPTGGFFENRKPLAW